MTFFKTIATLIMMLMAFAPQSFASKTHNPAPGANSKVKAKNRRLLVLYKNGVSEKKKDKAHFSAGAYVVKSFDLPTNLDVVEVAKGISLKAAQEFYKNDPNVMYVEPDHPLRAFFSPPPSEGEDPVEPSTDPKFSEQWGLNNSGQTGGTEDMDINAPQMWERIGGDKNVVIAVIDTGINYDHPDLQKNVWTNPGEIAGNGIDDDENGVIDDVHGFNAIDESGDPKDDNGHGSHCSGIIGAEGGSNYGGRGVMPDVSIIGCKFLDAAGSGTTEGAISCLNYLLALKNRAKDPVDIFATSNSWGGAIDSEILEAAIRDHRDAGILFLAAASNEGGDNDVIDTFPANYPLSNIVSVAAIDHNGVKADFSNFGKRTVHVGSPGVDVLSTVLGDEYEKMSGTSMATPFAAGLAGMIKANDPSLNYVQVKNLLIAGGVPTESLDGVTVSGRRIRAVDEGGLGSLTCENQVVSARLSPSKDRVLLPVGESITLSAININCDKPNGDIVVPSPNSNEIYKLKDDGLNLDDTPQDGMYTKVWTATEPGRFEFVFPKNDHVVVNVYDPSLIGTYAPQEETEFRYRKFKGTELEATDDWITTIDAPFPLRFGGLNQGFDLVTIGSNGAMSVTDTNPIDMGNTELPNPGFTSFIAPLWDDLNPAESKGTIQYGVLGEAPHREFIVEWKTIRHYNSKNAATFQVVFFEGSPDILFNYNDLDFANEELNFGSSATVGIQSSKERFTQVSYNTPSLQNKKAIRFKIVE